MIFCRKISIKEIDSVYHKTESIEYLDEQADIGLDILFDNEQGELLNMSQEEDELFSQEFSQVSLYDSPEVFQSPANKKVKLEHKDEDSKAANERTKKCKYCGINIGDKKSIPDQNDKNSCPEAPNCLRLRGGAAHMRQPHHQPAPHLAPDPDLLAPHLL